MRMSTELIVKWNEWKALLVACLDEVFEISDRSTTIQCEVLCGYINFISCLYVLPVIPNQLAAAGYDKTASIATTALACSVGSILSSYLTNLPFIVAPPTAVSIFLAVALQQNGMSQDEGDSAVIYSGIVLLLIGILKPVSTFVTKLIPDCIQASTAVGIGLITALAGVIELKLVVTGKYTLLELGEITPAIVIAMGSVIVLAASMHFHIKGSFMLALSFGTFVWWWYADAWPSALSDFPFFETTQELFTSQKVFFLLMNLIFLYVLTLNGIARSLSDLSELTSFDKSIPRGNWLFIVCGITTILSGILSGPPILISPESAAGIKAGSKTGLSTLVTGALFGLSLFFTPILADVPPAGTSPLLIVVGMMMFINANRIRWSEPVEAIPAFFVLLLIPFTYSVICGISFGYILFISLGLVTGQFYDKLVFAYKTAMYWRIGGWVQQPSEEAAESGGGGDSGAGAGVKAVEDVDPSSVHHGTGGLALEGSNGYCTVSRAEAGSEFEMVDHQSSKSGQSNKSLSSKSGNIPSSVTIRDRTSNQSRERSISVGPPLVRDRGNSVLQSTDSPLGRDVELTLQSFGDLESAISNNRVSTGSRRVSMGGTRQRTGSVTDRLSMDMETHIQSLVLQ